MEQNFRRETIESIREFCEEYGLPIEKYLGEGFENNKGTNCLG